MFGEALADFPGEIESGKSRVLLFEFLDNSETLSVVLEPTVILHEPVESVFPIVTEGGMTEVMGEGDGLGQILVEPQGAGDVSGDGRHLHGMCEPGAEVITRAVQENLGLVLQSAEGS